MADRDPYAIPRDDRDRGSRDDRHRSSRHHDEDRYRDRDRERRSDRDRERDHSRRDDRGERGDRDRHRGGGEREYRDRGGDREARYSSSRDAGPPRGEDRYSRHDRPPREDRGADGDWRSGRGGHHEHGGGFGGGRGGGRGGRGGGGGGGGGGRDGMGTPERRSPTPDTAVPLSQRKRTASGWDVHAPGYEQYTAVQAKQTGLFNLPGSNRMPMAPIAPIPGLPPGMMMGLGPSPNLARQSRRLYIGSITPEITEENLTKFFNQKMREMNLGQQNASGDPVLAVQVNYEKNYAFVEFRSADDATAAMAFDGIIFQSGPLRIRRPKDYMGNEYSAPSAMHVPGVVSTNVPDSLHKIFVGGLPTYLNEEQVMELLKSFGELKAFNLVRENNNGPSKGYAFFEYVDEEVTEVAIQGLNGMELGDRVLAVQRASVGSKNGMVVPNPDIPYDQMPEVPRPIMPLNEAPTQDARILLMLNMVVPEDLVDDEEFAELYEDVKEECAKYGAVEDLRIPRPAKRSGPKYGPAAVEAQRVDEAAGVGRVYVMYFKSSDASTALRSLAGRSFAGRSIIASLLSENSNASPPLSIIFAAQPAPPAEAAPPPPSF